MSATSGQPYSPSEFDLRSQLAEVRMELQWRSVGFPKLVARGLMTQDHAERRTAAMEAVAITLMRVLASEDEPRQPKLL